MHTFVFEGLSLVILDQVYEPAEDSFLLAKHAKTCTGQVLEVCTGTGIVAISNARHNPMNRVVAVDLNPVACHNAQENARANNLSIEVRQGDLFSAILPTEKFDWVLCNPPYLPASEEERISGPLDYALNSGKDGREFLDRFLAHVGAFLKPNGKVLLIHSSYQDLGKTAQWLTQHGCTLTILEKEEMGEEILYCLLIEEAGSKSHQLR